MAARRINTFNFSWPPAGIGSPSPWKAATVSQGIEEHKTPEYRTSGGSRNVSYARAELNLRRI
jgi:hypothetical protein